MRKLTWFLAVVGLAMTADFALGQNVVTTPSELMATVTSNEAALDRQVATGGIEIRGMAKKIVRTETGYTLQFLPDNETDNFVRLQIHCEFPATDRDALGVLLLPSPITVRGTVKQSGWTPKYDNHKYYTLVVKDCTFTANPPVVR